jgi:tetratricopeptide (TPR) repeat protein
MPDTTGTSAIEIARKSFHEGESLFNAASKTPEKAPQIRLLAQEKFQAALDAGYKPAECLLYMGLIALNGGKVANAITLLRASIKADPNGVSSHYFLGEAYRINEDEEGARKEYEAVRDLDPGYKDVLQRLAQIQSKHLTPVTYQGDIYDLLRGQHDDFSVAAIRLIDETRLLNRRPFVSAYGKERFLWSLPILILLVIGIGMVYSGYQQQTNSGKTDASITANIGKNEASWVAAHPGMGNSPTATQQFNEEAARYQVAERAANSVRDEGGFIIALAAFVYCLYRVYVRSIKVKVITIDRGMITVESGLFSTKRVIYEIYRTSGFEVEQDFFNLKTRDASLVLIFDDKKKESIRGLLKYEELSALATKLRALHLVLRSTNINKGVMGT